MRILLQPSAGKEATKHFNDTIIDGFPFEFFEDKVTSEEYKKIISLERDKIKVWGIVPTLNDQPRKEWLNLQEGDLVLFYAKK